jgi:hypothetical protein
MIGFIQEIVNVAEKYSLSVSSIDTTDITLLARLELFPAIYIQVYRNIQKNKINMVLVFGNNRIYGIDNEGGFTHEHPQSNPESHIPIEKSIEVEEFILNCFDLLKERGIL